MPQTLSSSQATLGDYDGVLQSITLLAYFERKMAMGFVQAEDD